MVSLTGHIGTCVNPVVGLSWLGRVVRYHRQVVAGRLCVSPSWAGDLGFRALPCPVSDHPSIAAGCDPDHHACLNPRKAVTTAHTGTYRESWSPVVPHGRWMDAVRYGQSPWTILCSAQMQHAAVVAEAKDAIV